MTDLSNEMADLAEQVKEASAATSAALLAGAEAALKAGELLIAAKEKCPHGSWLAFLERAGVQKRSAQRYMALARSGLISDTVAHLGGMNAALEFASSWRLPSGGESLAIVSREGIEAEGHEKATVQLEVAYVSESAEYPGLYDIVVFKEDSISRTQSPMRHCVEGEGFLPINALVYWLTKNYEVPIHLWHLETVPGRLSRRILGDE